MPSARARSTGVWRRNRQPSQIDLATDGWEMRSLAVGLRISRRKKMVIAETPYVTALNQSARFTLFGLSAGITCESGRLIRASTENSPAATGAVPYVVSRLSWLACSSLSLGTRLGIVAEVAGFQNSDAQPARNLTI